MGGVNDDQPPSGGVAGSMSATPSCSPVPKQPTPNQLRLSDPQLAACQMTVVRSVGGSVEDVSVFTYDPRGHLTLEEYASRVGGMVNRRISRSVDGQDDLFAPRKTGMAILYPPRIVYTPEVRSQLQ